MTPAGYGIDWIIQFRFSGDGAATWYRGSDGVARVVDALAGSKLWPELQWYGHDFEPGTPLLAPAELTARAELATGIHVLARGGENSTMYIDEAELAVVLQVRRSELELQIRATGESLRRLGPAMLDDGIAIVVELHRAWRGRGQLLRARARPFSDAPFVYPRPSPRRSHDRGVDAIVDVIATDYGKDADNARAHDESRALAAALPALPDGVTPLVVDGLQVIRWVNDPNDVDAVGVAAGRHEAWIAGALETDVAE